MLNTLFMPGRPQHPLWRDNLKMPARLLLLFVVLNIMPRRSDKQKVRKWDIQILYALLTGTPTVSFRYLAMMNIWRSRDIRDKAHVPHCRLILALIQKQGAFPPTFIPTTKELSMVSFSNIKRFQWEFKKTNRYFRLKQKSTGEKWRVLKPDARPLDPGEEDMLSEDSIVLRGDEEEGDEFMQRGTAERVVGGSSSGVHAGFQQGHGAPFMGSSYYPFGGGEFNMTQHVESLRPDDYDEWTGYQQARFDQSSVGFEQARRDSQSIYDRMEMWNRVREYNFQDEVNLRRHDHDQQRLHGQWMRNEPLVPNPPYVDYSTLPPYDGENAQPTPAIHHSRWLDPYAQSPAQDQGGQNSSSSGAFDFAEISNTMRSIFGDPRSPYH